MRSKPLYFVTPCCSSLKQEFRPKKILETYMAVNLSMAYGMFGKFFRVVPSRG